MNESGNCFDKKIIWSKSLGMMDLNIFFKSTLLGIIYIQQNTFILGVQFYEFDKCIQPRDHHHNQI